MNLRLNIIIIVLGLALIFYLISMIKKNNCSLKYSLSYLFATFFVILVLCIPNLLEFITHVLGIKNTINTLFFLGFGFVLIILYSITISQFRHSERIRQLAQKVAIDEYINNKKD